MATELILNRRGSGFVPADEQSREAMLELPIAKPLKAKITQPRNYKFHQKAFSLLQLSFDYWEPETMITTVEQATCNRLADYLIRSGIDGNAVATLTNNFLEHLELTRESIEAEKSFEAFRKWVTVESGFYDTVLTPSGPRKEARSWSFANMAEDEFSAMFRAILDVCWKLVLSRHFETEQAAQNAADQLTDFT